MSDPAEIAEILYRDRLAAWMIENGFATGHGDWSEDLLKELAQQIGELRRDKALLDKLQRLEPDTIYLDDGRIIDIAGRRTVREAIDSMQEPK